MTKSYLCWVYLLLLAACQLCAALGDVGGGACTGLTDGLDCDISGGDPSITTHDDDDDDDDGGSIATTMQGHETIDINSFIDATMARVGTLTKSRMGKTYSIVDTFFGAFLPEALNPARSTATRQTELCFVEVDSMLEDLRATSSTPDATTTAMSSSSAAAMNTVSEDTTTTSWYFCRHTKTLMQLDPAVPASHVKALALSPFFVADKGSEEKKDDDDWDIDDFLNGIFFGGESPLCPEAANSGASGGGQGLGSVDACYYSISDKIESKNSEHDDGGGGGGINSTADLDDDDGITGQGLSPGLRQAPAPAMDPSMLPMDEGRQAPAPAMDPAMFVMDETQPAPAPAPAMAPSLSASSGKARPPLPSAMDPALYPFADESHSPAPALDPALSRFDDEFLNLLPSAMMDDLSLSPSPFFEQRSLFHDVTAPPPQQQQQRKLRGTAMKDHEDSDTLAIAHRAVAADEPFELEAFIIATTRKFEETKARDRKEEDEQDGRSYVARAILDVVEDVAVYVGDLLVEVLPDWINPSSGSIIWHDECFVESDHLDIHPDWKERDVASNFSPDEYKRLFSDIHDLDSIRPYDGTAGWFFCAAKNRLVQQDPFYVCPENALTGRSFEETEHLQDQDQDSDYDYNVDSPVDAIVASDYAVYQAEHMQLALYLPLESHLPAAVGALLARHIAELGDEHAALETVLESFLVRDEERNRVELEKRIATQMQHLLSGGHDKQVNEEEEEEEKPLPPVCRVTEYYTFVPTDATSEHECSAPPDASWPPPMDECTPPETLHGNDEHVTSRSDCRLYLHEHPFRFTPVSIEENFAFSFYYDTAASPGSLYYLPGLAPSLVPREPGVVERLVERLVDFVGDAWTGAREVFEPVLHLLLSKLEPVFHLLQSKLAKLFELLEQAVSSYADDGSIEPSPKGVDLAEVINFSQSSMAQTGSAAFSRTVAKLAGVVDNHFGAFLPDTVSPAKYMPPRQARMCFREVDSMLGYLSSASPTAIAIAERASRAAGAAPAGDPSSIVWFFCAHTQSLVQLNPAVRAFRGSDNARRLSPPPVLFAEGEEGEEEDWDIDVILLKSENDGDADDYDGDEDDDDDYDGFDTDLHETDRSCLTDDDIATDGSSSTDGIITDSIVTDGGTVTDGILTDDMIVTDGSSIADDGSITDGSSVNDDADNVSSSGTTTTAAPAASLPPPPPPLPTTTIVTSSRDTVVTVSTGTTGQTATITFAADTPTVGTHTTTIVYST